MTNLELQGASALECSPETPWGLHLAVTENVCPRCGWTAREPRVGTEEPPTA